MDDEVKDDHAELPDLEADDKQPTERFNVDEARLQEQSRDVEERRTVFSKAAPVPPRPVSPGGGGDKRVPTVQMPAPITEEEMTPVPKMSLTKHEAAHEPTTVNQHCRRHTRVEQFVEAGLTKLLEDVAHLPE
eukprot:11249309-Alexandrium_andersonii.AAC.1